MINKIVFFNHYHRGDIFTHRAFIRHLKKELNDIDFEYLHFNHPKLTRDIEVPLVGDPSKFSKKEQFRIDKNTLYLNTWIGAYGKAMKRHGGLNMLSLYDQWTNIFRIVNDSLKKNIIMHSSKEKYLPDVDFSFYNLDTINDYVKNNTNKKVLICNGSPKSNQSFLYNMVSFIDDAAEKSPNVHFICTEKFETNKNNIFFTDDIISCTDIEEKRAPWEDRSVNICDLPEISYLSEQCDLIVGKNSGPFCFCETQNNYLDKNKKFLSYNVSWGLGDLNSESMSYGLKLECEYKKILIENVDPLSDNDILNITTSLNETIETL